MSAEDRNGRGPELSLVACVSQVRSLEFEREARFARFGMTSLHVAAMCPRQRSAVARKRNHRLAPDDRVRSRDRVQDPAGTVYPMEKELDSDFLSSGGGIRPMSAVTDPGSNIRWAEITLSQAFLGIPGPHLWYSLLSLSPFPKLLYRK